MVLKTHWRLISRIERILDNILIIGAFFLSYYARDILLQRGAIPETFGSLPVLGPIEDYLIVLGSGLPLFNSVLSILGCYRSMRFSSYWKVLRQSATASFVVFLCLGSVLYLLKLDLSRSFVGLFCALSGTAVFALRVGVMQLLRYFRLRGKNYRNLLIFGTGEQARRMHQEIARSGELGVRVVGFVASTEDLQGNGAQDASAVYDLAARVVARPGTFEQALKRYAVDEVLFTEVVPHFKTVKELAQIAVEEGVRVTLAADFFSLNIFKSEVSYFGSTPLVHYHPSPAAVSGSSLIAKRVMDVVVSAMLLTVLSPLLLLTAIAIRLDSKGPIFFRQRRVGLNGRTFVLLKFRSMVDGAEKLLEPLIPKNEMNGPVFKIKNDPRVTRVGRQLRRYSIDELPQLINVLRGDMSLVGPRPPIPEEVSQYMRKQRKRLSMRPGLTCTWQVSGRNEIPDFESWAQLDLEYINNWSIWNDIKLLFRTIPAVLTGSGAR